MADDDESKNTPPDGAKSKNTPPDGAIGTMLEQAHDIGEATARLEGLQTAHEATRAAVEDTKSSVQFLGDRVSGIETTIAKMADDIAALKPAAAAEAGAEGASEEAGAAAGAIDGVDPKPAAENVAEKKRGPLAWLHEKLS